MNNPNPNYPTDRSASSTTRETDVVKSKYPIVTRTAYAQCVQKPSSMVDIKMRSLCLGRNGIGVALLNLDKALHDFNPQVSKDGRDREIYNKLRGLRSGLEKLQLKYPLEVR